MLLKELPTNIIDAYQRDISTIIFPNLLEDYDQLDNLSSDKMVKFLEELVDSQQQIRTGRAFAGANLQEVCKYFMHPNKGRRVQRVPGFFSMDTLFVERYFEHIEDFRSSVSGVFVNFDELTEHASFLVGDPDFKQYIGTKNYVIRVEKSKDWALFETLYPRGRWGWETTHASELAKEFSWKQRVAKAQPRSKYRITEGITDSHPTQYRKRIIPSNVVKYGRKKWNPDGSLPDWENYVNRYLECQQKHDSFYFFEVLIVPKTNSSYIL